MSSQLVNLEFVEVVNSREVVEIIYQRQRRVVEPHCYGVNKKGNQVIRAYQVGGYSSSGSMGWKIYLVDEIERLVRSGTTFEVRREFEKGDSAMQKIFAEVSR